MFSLTPCDNERLLSLCGRFDEHLRLIERHFDIEIAVRGNKFSFSGEQDNISSAKQVLTALYQQTAKNNALAPYDVQLLLQHHAKHVDGASESSGNLSIVTSKKTVTARNKSQALYINNINNHTVTFGIGPAGTGKTFLAVATAVAALEQELIQRIILVRPVVETGEKLGFLPGDLAQKVDPYLRPIYDALFALLGFNRTQQLLEQQIIEIAPLAYMRGRTLENAFIILDESQNTTVEQMKMFLTRIGFGATVVITGDITQVDLPKRTTSGLEHAMKILKPVPNISFNFFDVQDVVRHSIVQEIIKAYESRD